jgi:probable selenium-dependent hydroxylase accessory protein YqeC
MPAIHAFRLDGFRGTVALVGAGGKTALMFRLAREIAATGESAVATTTTRIRVPTSRQSPFLILTHEDSELSSLPNRLQRYGYVTVGGVATEEDKVSGVNETTLLRCRDTARVTLIEADGAAGRSLKAPESWEPVIPAFCDMVIPVTGLDCLGRPASSDCVFRLDRLREVAGIREGDTLTPQIVAKVIASARGGLKNVPECAIVAPYLNKSDLCPPRLVDETAEEILRLGRPRIRKVVAGSLLFGFCGCVYE